jgi:hypothetical protein
VKIRRMSVCSLLFLIRIDCRNMFVVNYFLIGWCEQIVEILVAIKFFFMEQIYLGLALNYRILRFFCIYTEGSLSNERDPSV